MKKTIDRALIVALLLVGGLAVSRLSTKPPVADWPMCNPDGTECLP